MRWGPQRNKWYQDRRELIDKINKEVQPSTPQTNRFAKKGTSAPGSGVTVTTIPARPAAGGTRGSLVFPSSLFS